MTGFVTQTVLKRDLFSETRKGHLEDAPEVAVIRREVSAAPLWTRPLAWMLARREIAALRAVAAIEGTPRLIGVDRDGLLRTWTAGTPLHLARPAARGWYGDAFRLLRDLRRAGVTHNDLAKPQNWLATREGRAAVIDFQLAFRHRRRGALYRLMAYEDFRHLLKQMRAFAPELMTPAGKRLLARRSWPSRIWRASGKRFYNLVTRGLFHWSDGEGTHDRLVREGPAIRTTLLAVPAVREVALAAYPFPKKGVGIYAFVETDDPQAALDAAQQAPADLVQPVAALPRCPAGRPRLDLLGLVAMNEITELLALVDGDERLAAVMDPIVEGRLNLSDRRIAHLE